MPGLTALCDKISLWVSATASGAHQANSAGGGTKLSEQVTTVVFPAISTLATAKTSLTGGAQGPTPLLELTF